MWKINMSDEFECPMCEPGTCIGGAHVFALREDGITTKEQYQELKNKGEQNNEPWSAL